MERNRYRNPSTVPRSQANPARKLGLSGLDVVRGDAVQRAVELDEIVHSRGLQLSERELLLVSENCDRASFEVESRRHRWRKRSAAEGFWCAGRCRHGAAGSRKAVTRRAIGGAEGLWEEGRG